MKFFMSLKMSLLLRVKEDVYKTIELTTIVSVGFYVHFFYAKIYVFLMSFCVWNKIS